MTFHSSWRRTGGSSVLQRAILNDSPLAYWPLDESSGSFLDRSGNGFHLTNTGATYRDNTLLNDSTQYPFFGSTARGSRAGTLGLSMPFTGDFTLEVVAMVPVNNPGNKASFFAFSSSGETLATNYQLSPGVNASTGYLSDLWEYGAGTNVVVDSDYIIPSCRPQHLVYQRDSTNMLYKFFVNGMEVCKRTFANLPAGGTSNSTYVGWPTSTNGVSWLGHVAFFTSLLTEKQIREHFICTGLQSL